MIIYTDHCHAVHCHAVYCHMVYCHAVHCHMVYWHTVHCHTVYCLYVSEGEEETRMEKRIRSFGLSVMLLFACCFFSMSVYATPLLGELQAQTLVKNEDVVIRVTGVTQSEAYLKFRRRLPIIRIRACILTRLTCS